MPPQVLFTEARGSHLEFPPMRVSDGGGRLCLRPPRWEFVHAACVNNWVPPAGAGPRRWPSPAARTCSSAPPGCSPHWPRTSAGSSPSSPATTTSAPGTAHRRQWAPPPAVRHRLLPNICPVRTTANRASFICGLSN
jgi:hypothetical protein